MARLPALPDIDFVLLPRRGLRSLGIAAGAGLGFGAWMAFADATVFANVVPQVQHDMVAEAGPLARIAWFARGAFYDEVQLRLIALPVFTWAAMALTIWHVCSSWALIRAMFVKWQMLTRRRR